MLAGLTGKTKPDNVIIFSAHCDHIGTFSINPFPSIHPAELRKKDDRIYNGANDDASGVTASILLANGVTSKDVDPNFLKRVGEAFETGASVIN